MEQEKKYERARVPKRFWGNTLADYDVKRGDEGARDAVGNFLDNLEERLDSGVGLTLAGLPGGGKTMLASILLQGVLDADHSGMFRTLASYIKLNQKRIDLSNIVRAPFVTDDDITSYSEVRADLDAMVNRYKVLVLDDVGKEHLTSTEWASREFDYLARHRFDKGLVTVITTNVPIPDWTKHYGAAMESFIWEAAPPVAVMAPKDFRKRS